MSSEKSRLIRLAFIALLVINVALCVFVIRTARYKASGYNFYQGYLYDYCMKSSSVDILEIRRALEQHLNSEYDNQPSMICLFIPPHPCGACVDKELNIFLKDDNLANQKRIIFTPNNRYRDIRTKIKGDESIIVYDTEDDMDSFLNSINGVLYIHMTYGSIDDVFLSNEWVSDASINYIKRHQ